MKLGAVLLLKLNPLHQMLFAGAYVFCIKGLIKLTPGSAERSSINEGKRFFCKAKVRLTFKSATMGRRSLNNRRHLLSDS